MKKLVKKLEYLKKKHRETKVRLEKEILFLNIENWKTIRKKIKTELDRSNVY